MACEHHAFDSLNHAATTLAAALSHAIRSLLLTHERMVLALPGGITPSPLFQELVSYNLPWEKIILTLSDERFVPTSSNESNARALRENLIEKISPPPHFIPLVTTLQNSAVNLKRAIQQLNKLSTYPILIVIGMGTDGHIASLFSAEDLQNTGILCITRTPNGIERISMTLPALCKAQKIFLLIAGNEKNQVLKNVLLHHDKSPISSLIELAADKIAIYESQRYNN